MPKQHKNFGVDRGNPGSGSNKKLKSHAKRHPEHLKGKEIGLWYASQSKNRKDHDEVARIKSMGKIIIPPGRAQEIQEFLNKLPPIQNLNFEGNYRGVPNSKFKNTFLDIIETNIKQKLDNLTESKRCKVLDQQLCTAFKEQQKSHKYLQMQRCRERLPAFKLRSHIVELINSQQIVIISGETGCGKTTQIPQFILDDHLQNGRGSICKIVCSQPRRISAISVAERIADERGESLGGSVGYQIRLENRLPRNRGSILFCTTGVILKQMEGNVGLDGVSHLILDEIHERDVLCDFIIALLKQVVNKRSDLKVILMSATLNAEKFAEYFAVDNIINIPGFTHDVKEYYLEDALLRTGFQFPGDQPKRRLKRRAHGDDEDKTIFEFKNFILPHVRKLEASKLYPLSVRRELLKTSSEDGCIELAVALVKDISYKEGDDGAILVFLTGYGDISKMNQLMETSGAFPSCRFLIIPLHSQMPSVQQKAIFNPPPPGIRKIILATNIAETSITIDDVVFVIDCGKIKISDFNSDNNEDTLKPQWVSRANADQRRGRAGRVRPGVCYHLFSMARNMLLDDFIKPELLRKRLDSVILNLKLLQLGSAEAFLSTCLDPPEFENIQISIDFLKRLNALDDNEVLTPLGYHLARLPVAPQMGKMMLLGALFSCINPIVDIASALDFKDAFLMPLGKEEQCRKQKRQLADGCMSDHLLFHYAMTQYESAYDKSAFCWEYFLSKQTMSQLAKMKTQFATTLHELNFLQSADVKLPIANINSKNVSLLKAVICASLYPNVFINKRRIAGRSNISTFTSLDRKKLEIHPKSVVMRTEYFDSPFLVYYRKVRSTSTFVHDVSVVHTLPLIFFGDRFKVIQDNGRTYMSVNDSLTFATNDETLQIIEELRRRLYSFLEMKACQPAPVNWDDEDEVGVLKAIIELITIEHEGFNFEDFDIDNI